jgi:hypothetical protein
MHKQQHSEYVAAVTKEKEACAVSTTGQPSIGKHFPKTSKTKEQFKRKFGRWVVEDGMPLTCGQSESFKAMIQVANKNVDMPCYKTTVDMLHAKKLDSSNRLKAYIKGQYFSITMDHWTSLANENYGAITLHFIDNFQLKAFVLSCTKHENGCRAIEMERQLVTDLQHWGLEKAFFVCCVTDSASNMNSLGEMLDGWADAPHLRHYYCADHILQLTAVLAYSGNIQINDNGDSSASCIRKARNLVSHINSSNMAAEKIARAQRDKTQHVSL